MSLRNCSACSNPIGPHASKCPNCGEPTLIIISPYFDPFSTGENHDYLYFNLQKYSFVLIVLGFLISGFGDLAAAEFGVKCIYLGILGLLTCWFPLSWFGWTEAEYKRKDM